MIVFIKNNDLYLEGVSRKTLAVNSDFGELSRVAEPGQARNAHTDDRTVYYRGSDVIPLSETPVSI